MKLGNIADGDHFHGRKREIAELLRLLSTDNNIVFSGPRRLGKSSLLRHLCSAEGGYGINAVHLDLAGSGGVKGFFKDLDRNIPEEMIRRLLRDLADVAVDVAKSYAKAHTASKLGDSAEEVIKQLTQTQSIDLWRPLAESLRKRLSPLPLVIMLDEFSVFLDKSIKSEREDVVNLLDWLRAWRQSPDTKCRFIFTGSISLNSVLESNELLSRFNDCYDFRLDAFTLEEAKALLTEEAKRLDWQLNEKILQYTCDKLGWLAPYFLNLLLDESIKTGTARLEETGAQTRQLELIDVDLGYERVVSVGSRFVYWHQRLRVYLDADELAIALAVLAAIARSHTGTLTRSSLRARLHKLDMDPVRRSQRLDAMLMTLSEEGYLIQNEDSVQFLSPLLRDYWKRNHA